MLLFVLGTGDLAFIELPLYLLILLGVGEGFAL